MLKKVKAKWLMERLPLNWDLKQSRSFLSGERHRVVFYPQEQIWEQPAFRDWTLLWRGMEYRVDQKVLKE